MHQPNKKRWNYKKYIPLVKFTLPLVAGVTLMIFVLNMPGVKLGNISTPPIEPTLIQKKLTIKKNSSTYQSLTEAGIDSPTIAQIVTVTKPVYDLKNIQAGTNYILESTKDNKIHSLTFLNSTTQRLQITSIGESWSAKMVDIPTTKKIVHYQGDVQDSLWLSGLRSDVPPYLIISLAEVFSWEIDFYREIRPGDSWTFSAEQIFAEGKPVGWGEIVYAEYINSNESHKAYHFSNKEKGVSGHFTETGASLRRMFLKSPLRFGRISSRFSKRRLHPIKKVYRPHLGVDYAAPKGTPIRTIGDGRIIKKGRFGGAGKMISIRHPGGYKTRYLHLSRYKHGIRNGSRVQQGQIIGYVGSTGAATGPHLHFELFKGGRYKDPLRVKLPASGAIPKTLLPNYLEYVKKINNEHSAKKIL